jgi:integrase
MLDVRLFSIPPSEEPVPPSWRRWVEEGKEWLEEKQSRGKYVGRNGYEALRFLRKCGEWVSATPQGVTEADLWAIVKRLGPSPKTKLSYLALLGSFLSWRGNWIVQRSGIRSAFPNRALNTPVIPVEERDRILTAAQGPERLVISLLALGRRRIEVLRVQVSDFHLDRVPPTYGVRGKGGAGQVTHELPVTDSLLRELAWWLPLREEWASRATSDTGHLVCRWDNGRLVGVSAMYADRALHSAEDRAGVHRWPAHSFRRGLGTLLRERGADWEDVSAALTHASPETTRLYVSPLIRNRRLATVLRLVEPAALEAKA